MGLLQRLFGRQEDGDKPAAAEDTAPIAADDATARPAPDGGVLGDAAPLPEPADEPPPAEPVDEPREPIEEEAEEEPVLLTAPPEGDEEDVPLATVLPFRGTTVDEDEPADETPAPEAPVVPEFPDLFTPSRPRRELLGIEKPAAPEPEPDETPAPPPEVLPADTSGSPRAALRAAGVAVPPMHLVTTRGDARLWAFPVSDTEALGWWLEIRRVHDRTGWLPVLLGAAEGWLDDAESVLHEGDDELARLAEIDVEELLRTKAAEAGEPPRGVATLPTRGDSVFTVAKAPGLLGLVQAEHGWQVPALLPWAGSTNWEIFGAEHAAILRRWDEYVDVEVVAMSWDVLELYVAEPPTDPQEALALAGEVYAYCPDLLAAGVPTLDDLAQHMVKSKAWYFRWND
ncbi:hypothetical protein Afil01_60100 [Actinorhabdospora filicis]|uniref:DUF4253 domain-containing protein n=1 Tax=Actinorhabdospora filicis TaxID=1785913 RepID=A0A9W6WCL4_9ACTN|nr:DUF4253 domain-containing protein [Actinorhabdospora filicis]GLZ81203.1 hypothetical protein Afil01_60100 [Actinorhabdospora filicis]